MRDQMKVIIGFGSIWGLFAFGAAVFGLLTLGANDTAPEILGLALYGFTTLPACLVAIWRQKSAAVWLIALSPVSAFGLVYQVVTRPTTGTSLAAFVAKLVEVLFIAAIPGFLGICMLQTGPRMEMTRGLEIPRE